MAVVRLGAGPSPQKFLKKVQLLIALLQHKCNNTDNMPGDVARTASKSDTGAASFNPWNWAVAPTGGQGNSQHSCLSFASEGSGARHRSARSATGSIKPECAVTRHRAKALAGDKANTLDRSPNQRLPHILTYTLAIPHLPPIARNRFSSTPADVGEASTSQRQMLAASRGRMMQDWVGQLQQRQHLNH